MLMQRVSLPWEGSNLTAHTKQRLGIMRKPVLGLLDRRPGSRPTMREVITTMSNLFNNNHVAGAPPSSAS